MEFPLDWVLEYSQLAGIFSVSQGLIVWLLLRFASADVPAEPGAGADCPSGFLPRQGTSPKSRSQLSPASALFSRENTAPAAFSTVSEYNEKLTDGMSVSPNLSVNIMQVNNAGRGVLRSTVTAQRHGYLKSMASER